MQNFYREALQVVKEVAQYPDVAMAGLVERALNILDSIERQSTDANLDKARQAVEAYRAGKKIPEIAAEMKTSRKTVWRHLQRYEAMTGDAIEWRAKKVRDQQTLAEIPEWRQKFGNGRQNPQETDIADETEVL